MIFEKYCKYMCISLMIETPFKLNAFVVHCVYDIYIIYIYIYIYIISMSTSMSTYFFSIK